MTREEAIKIFQLMKKILSIPNSDAARTIEAIDMAIEALSADAVPQSEQYKKGFEDCKRAYEIELARSADRELANLKEEFESAVPNCQKCAIKELWEATEKEDVVSVVRCKDCRFWKNEHLCLVMSRYGSIDTKAEHYCSWGERREP